jgi:hypothetical protein
MAGSVVSLEPKANVRSEAGDPIDRAAQAILGLLHRTAADAEAKNQQALVMTHQLSVLELDLTVGAWLSGRVLFVRRDQAAIIFSFAIGMASRKVCIGVLPKHQRP